MELEVTNTLITGLIPPGGVGEEDIVIRFSDNGALVVERRTFLYTNTPLIMPTMTPTNGPPTGGETGIVTGSRFAPGAMVQVGENAATGVVVTPTLIHFTIPSSMAGTVDVIVTNPDRRQWILSGGYTYDPFPPPVIDGIHPIEGTVAGGTEITVKGSHFLNGVVVIIGETQVEQLDAFSPTEIPHSIELRGKVIGTHRWSGFGG